MDMPFILTNSVVFEETFESPSFLPIRSLWGRVTLCPPVVYKPYRSWHNREPASLPTTLADHGHTSAVVVVVVFKVIVVVGVFIDFLGCNTL